MIVKRERLKSKKTIGGNDREDIANIDRPWVIEETRANATKKQSRESVERNERRIRRRNEEIKKGGIEIAKKANEKMEKEEEEEKKKDERRRTEDSLGVVCTLIYVAAYISAKGGKDE